MADQAAVFERLEAAGEGLQATRCQSSAGISLDEHINNLPPVDRARISARSASEQSTDTAVRAEVIMLRDENADLRFKLARSIEQLEDERAELADMRRKFEASQLALDIALRHLGSTQDDAPHTHDNVLLDKAIHPRGNA